MEHSEGKWRPQPQKAMREEKKSIKKRRGVKRSAQERCREKRSGEKSRDRKIGGANSRGAVPSSSPQNPNGEDVIEFQLITINELGEYENPPTGAGNRSSLTAESHLYKREKPSSPEAVTNKKKRKRQIKEGTGQQKRVKHQDDEHRKQKRRHLDVAVVQEKVKGSDFTPPLDRPGGSGVSSAGPGCRTPLSIGRFIYHQELGRGSYGRVLLASDTVTRRQLAVKVIKKRVVVEEDMIRSVLVEREALQAVRTPFVVRGLFAFQTEELLFLGMEYANGGDLYDLLERTGALDLNTATFYAAEIVCGLEHLHSKGYIHRDIKPENILIHGDGHIKIADLGLALNNMHEGDIATEYAGTTGYIAPEMEDFLGYNTSADWFSFGVVLFQMLTGQSPEDSRLVDIQDFSLDPDAENIIEKLLCEDPDKRLGVDGVIRDHPFFWSMDWERLEARKIPPPFIPSKPPKKSLPHLAFSDLLSATPSACESPISSVHQELFRGFSFETRI
ncbi:protein kinase C delta type-like [Pseudophryne corroboree]|uniref:protein kinase C delta type-like n=1 Tax=Pseudophryne corroboree TaxID=495146 RepID=UPI003081EA01